MKEAVSPILLEGLSYRHPGAEKPLFSSVDLRVERGDRLLLTGASGSGKSTLLSIMAGIIPKLYGGRLEGRVALSYSRASMVLQNPDAQLVTPTSFEEVAFGLENRGLPVEFIKERSLRALESLGLGDKAHKRTDHLSGGETQRLSLACAIALEPEVLFMDEPTSYLDPESSQRFFEALGRVEGIGTWVIVEHRLEEVSDLVTRALRLGADGRLAEVHPAALALGQAPLGNGGALDEARDAGLFPACIPSRLGFQALRHRYADGTVALDGLDGDLRPGEITMVMGPSGSGKSTLLKKLVGLLPFEKGQVFLDGKDASRLKARQLYEKILFIPQNPEHFFLSLSVDEEWAEARLDERKRSAISGLFGLGLDGRLSPSLLSEGEKRRLNLALAFADPRPILLLDEPTYGLDRDSFGALADSLQLLRTQGRTILVVTHSPELAGLCADRVLRLVGGRWEGSAS